MISPGNISCKKIPYLQITAVKDIDKEDYEMFFEDTEKNINNFINKVELHEMIHAYINNMFGIPSIIVYLFKYSPYFLARVGFCMHLKPLNRFQLILTDIVNFFWDLLDDCIHIKFNENRLRNPQDLLKKLVKDILKWGKPVNFKKFNSFNEIKTHIYEFSLDQVHDWDRGIYFS